jgi:hypothetical protein
MRITKTNFYLLLIFIFALAIRLFVAYHIDVGSDEMIYSVIPLNILGSGRISTVEQGPVYFFMTDIIYTLFGGMTTISIRFLGVFFGALASIVVFLFVKEIFGNIKMGLWSAFLFAVSGYAIRFNTEMDMLAFFFSLLSMLLFVQAVKGKPKKMYFSAIFLAIGVLVKPFILIFSLSFVIYWLRGGLPKSMIRTALVSVGIAVLVVTPVLAHNYISYKENGVTDYYFSSVAGIGEPVFEGIGLKEWELGRLGRYTWQMTKIYLKYDAIILIFGLLGAMAAFRKRSSLLLLSSGGILWVYLAGKTASSSHYIWLPLIFSIFAGYGITLAGSRSENIFKNKRFLSLTILVVITVSSFFMLQDAVEQRSLSLALELREFAIDNIPENSVIVMDPRIYRGIYSWALSDRHYLEGTSLNRLTELSGGDEVPFFYVRCREGDYCGWKPEDYARVYDLGNSMSEHFANNLQQIGTVKAVNELIIYKGSIPLNTEAAYELTDKSHHLWFTPVGWKYPELAYDYYVPSTLFRSLLYRFAQLILFIDVLIAFLSVVLVLNLLLKRHD